MLYYVCIAIPKRVLYAIKIIDYISDKLGFKIKQHTSNSIVHKYLQTNES